MNDCICVDKNKVLRHISGSVNYETGFIKFSRLHELIEKDIVLYLKDGIELVENNEFLVKFIDDDDLFFSVPKLYLCGYFIVKIDKIIHTIKENRIIPVYMVKIIFIQIYYHMTYQEFIMHNVGKIIKEDSYFATNTYDKKDFLEHVKNVLKDSSIIPFGDISKITYSKLEEMFCLIKTNKGKQYIFNGYCNKEANFPMRGSDYERTLRISNGISDGDLTIEAMSLLSINSKEWS